MTYDEPEPQDMLDAPDDGAPFRGVVTERQEGLRAPTAESLEAAPSDLHAASAPRGPFGGAVCALNLPGGVFAAVGSALTGMRLSVRPGEATAFLPRSSAPMMG